MVKKGTTLIVTNTISITTRISRSISAPKLGRIVIATAAEDIQRLVN